MIVFILKCGGKKHDDAAALNDLVVFILNCEFQSNKKEKRDDAAAFNVLKKWKTRERKKKEQKYDSASAFNVFKEK